MRKEEIKFSKVRNLFEPKFITSYAFIKKKWKYKNKIANDFYLNSLTLNMYIFQRISAKPMGFSRTLVKKYCCM